MNLWVRWASRNQPVAASASVLDQEHSNNPRKLFLLATILVVKLWMIEKKWVNTCRAKSSISKSFFLTQELSMSKAKLVLRTFSTWRLCFPNMSNPLASGSIRLAYFFMFGFVCRETAFRSRTVWLTFSWLLKEKTGSSVKVKFQKRCCIFLKMNTFLVHKSISSNT